jgi:hypothetical protein
MSTSVPQSTFFTLPDTGGLPTSQQEFLAQWVQSMQASFPGYTPAPGNPEYIQAEIISSWAADVAQLCTSGGTELFRQFGTQLLNLPYESGNPATAVLTVTAVDTAGYTLNALTQLTLTLGGVQVGFQTATALTIANGDSTGTVLVQALSAGASFNGATNPSSLVSQTPQTSWVSGISVVAAASGGVDQEDDSQYLQRLAATLQLLTPRPITASDYATLSLNFAPADGSDQEEIGRATAIDGYSPTSEVFTVTAVNTNPSLTVTAPPATGITAAPGAAILGTDIPSATFTANTTSTGGSTDVLTSVSSFTNLAVGDLLSGAGIPAGTTITVLNSGASTVTMSADATATASTVTITNSTAYVDSSTSSTIVMSAPATGSASGISATVAGTLGNERTVTVCVTDASGNALNSDTMTALSAWLESLREVNFVVNVVEPTYTTVWVTCSVTPVAGYTASQVQANVQTSILNLLTPANFGLPQGATTGWDNTTLIYASQLTSAIQNTSGVASIASGSLKFGYSASPSNTGDLALPGAFPLPTSSTTSVPTSSITIL